MLTEVGERHSECLETLPYALNYIPEGLRKRAKSELFEDEETRIHSLRLLRSMLKDETDLYWQDDDLFLLSFLRARKFDVKRAFSLMKTFYTVMRKHHELFAHFDFEDVKRTMKENLVGFLPHRDREGCVILILRFRRYGTQSATSKTDENQVWNPEVTSLADFMRTLTCGLLHAILSPATQIAGFKVIFDFNGLSLKHIPYITPNYLWLFAEALQNCFPGRFRAVHMVNESHLFSYIWAVLKHFLTKKLKGRFHFHGKEVSKLLDFFSPSILPVEYGGEQPPYDSSEWNKKMEESADYMTKVFSHGYKKNRARDQTKT